MVGPRDIVRRFQAPRDNPSDDGKMAMARGPRREAARRLQVGLLGLGLMVLLVGVANIVIDRARQAEAEVVPEAIASPEEAATPDQSDPLANAGVVPDLPREAESQPLPDGPVLPERGRAPQQQ